MTIICGHKWTQNQRKTLKITGKKCIFTNNRLKIIGFERFISIGYLSGILIGPSNVCVVLCRPALCCYKSESMYVAISNYINTDLDWTWVNILHLVKQFNSQVYLFNSDIVNLQKSQNVKKEKVITVIQLSLSL